MTRCKFRPVEQNVYNARMYNYNAITILVHTSGACVCCCCPSGAVLLVPVPSCANEVVLKSLLFPAGAISLGPGANNTTKCSVLVYL